MKKISWIIPKSRRLVRASWNISPETNYKKSSPDIKKETKDKVIKKNQLPYCSSRNNKLS